MLIFRAMTRAYPLFAEHGTLLALPVHGPQAIGKKSTHASRFSSSKGDVMKIAVSSAGPSLADPLDPRLGRCEYLLIVDPDSMEFEAIENENKTRGGGAGIQTARTIAERGATVVLTGNCGPNAYETLTAAGVQVITGLTGTVQDALDCYKKGGVAPSDGPNVQSHAGMGGSGPSAAGPGPGMGQGMGGGGGRGMGGGGRGMGGGGGRGMGCGRGLGGGGGRGMGMRSVAGTAPSITPTDMAPSTGAGEVSALRQEVQQITYQLEAILQRLSRLEKA
jgi:predicted Fe-Mo cluster-binding NifX family protein